MNFPSLYEWPLKSGTPFLIAGPCAAESREQVLAAAASLAPLGIHLFRSGIWKPRTRPNSFEGVGEAGLSWLREAKASYGIPVTVEVARSSHVELALKNGIDVLWIGARTTANPFAVQEIADALSGVSIPVFVKNPVNPEIELWIGAMERLHNAGIKNIAAIHRGFSSYGKSKYRNKPNWEIPIELKRRFPSLPMLCDPSHIAGSRHTILPLAQKALDLQFDGLMIEVHPEPSSALSDKSQQLTPDAFAKIISQLVLRSSEMRDPVLLASLEELRAIIDRIDEGMLDLLSERMFYAGKIGQFKKENFLAIYQPERYNQILENVKRLATTKNLSEDLMLKIFENIHKESIRKQTEVMNRAEKGSGEKTSVS